MMMMIDDNWNYNHQNQGATSSTASSCHENCPGLSGHCAASVPSNCDGAHFTISSDHLVMIHDS